MKLTRYENNPILSPNSVNAWENLVTTNPAAWYDSDIGEVKLIYRAAGDDDKHYVHLGLATSKNGYDFVRKNGKPIVSPIKDVGAGCIEDPRVIKMDGCYYITFAFRPFAPGKYWIPEDLRKYSPPVLNNSYPRFLRENLSGTGLLVSPDLNEFTYAGMLTNPSFDDRDVIIFPEKIKGKYVTLHRPMEWCGKQYGTDYPAMWIAFSDDLLGWKDIKLLAKGKYDWEQKIGGSTPPIKTKDGWLVIYHAVGKDRFYRVGAMLLDLENPMKILHRSPDWLLQPEKTYETQGLYNGVIFPCGNVVIDGKLFVYYGGADKYVGLATCELDELLDYLCTCSD
ncbi:MAG: glycosidase [Planctomycetes bacterium GWF2_41_51]|nr:MAG: glycosidase [Planctomycetes bacterium GWF2_41_51]HBG27208.1 glycosidase [Phycisphaerales bacterium]